jgi:4-oxalocrotonate tautomerase
MPIIEVKLVEGRDEQSLHAFAGALTEAACEFLNAPAASVRVLIHQIPPALFFVGAQTHSTSR